MRIVPGRDKAVEDFVSARAPLEPPHFGPCVTLAIIDSEGRLVGGIVYHNYRQRYQTIELSGAIDSWVAAGPQTAFEVIDFGFEKLGVQKIWTQSGLSNARALKVLRAYGFTREAVLAHEYGSEHCVRMRLLRRDWMRNRGHFRKAA